MTSRENRNDLGTLLQQHHQPNFLVSEFQFDAFEVLCKSFGLKISTFKNHVIPPSSVSIALGTEFDLEDNTVSLPLDKLLASLLE